VTNFVNAAYPTSGRCALTGSAASDGHIRFYVKRRSVRRAEERLSSTHCGRSTCSIVNDHFRRTTAARVDEAAYDAGRIRSNLARSNGLSGKPLELNSTQTASKPQDKPRIRKSGWAGSTVGRSKVLASGICEGGTARQASSQNIETPRPLF
jgi:hypothetical protein